MNAHGLPSKVSFRVDAAFGGYNDRSGQRHPPLLVALWHTQSPENALSLAFEGVCRSGVGVQSVRGGWLVRVWFGVITQVWEGSTWSGFCTYSLDQISYI